MDETLKKDIEMLVTKIFSEKEEVAQRQATQEALRDSANLVEDIKKTLETKEIEADTAITALKETVAAKDVEIAELTLKVETTSKEAVEISQAVEAAKKEAAEAIEALTTFHKDRAAELRVSELVAAKVITTDKVAEYSSKVRDMTDEEFATYKQDRVQLREAVIKELESATQAPAVITSVVTTASVAPVTPPAQIAPGHAIASAMNFETIPSEDVISKYAKLGEAMAANLKSEKRQ